MQDEEHVAFLPGETDQAARCAQRQKKRVSELWRYSTAILGVLLLVSLYASYWTRSSPSYRTGFDTDLGMTETMFLFPPRIHHFTHYQNLSR